MKIIPLRALRNLLRVVEGTPWYAQPMCVSTFELRDLRLVEFHYHPEGRTTLVYLTEAGKKLRDELERL
jgi:hypothetical protein